MKLLLAKPRGFCAGVDRAIEMVELTLKQLGAPVYVRHEVVHNRHVVERLKQRGVVFTDDLDDVPEGETVIFSAHGVSQAVRDHAARRKLKILDATCPLVTKVHVEVARYNREGRECILVGHAGHPEVEGTLGQYDHPEGGIYLVETVDQAKNLQVKNPDALGMVTQTTLSVDDTQAITQVLKTRFPHIRAPKTEDICYATTNRQEAVKELAPSVDVFIVVGSATSSNSNRLRELAARFGCHAYMVDKAEELSPAWFQHAKAVGITSGASAPEQLVRAVIEQLQAWGGSEVIESAAREETITFPIPKALRKQA